MAAIFYSDLTINPRPREIFNSFESLAHPDWKTIVESRMEGRAFNYQAPLLWNQLFVWVQELYCICIIISFIELLNKLNLNCVYCHFHNIMIHTDVK